MPIQIPGIDAPIPNLPTPPSGLTGKLLSAAPWLSKLGFIGRIAANPIGSIALWLLADKLLFGRGGSNPDEKLLREQQQNAAVANAMLMADESEQRRMQGLSEIGALGAARSGAAQLPRWDNWARRPPSGTRPRKSETPAPGPTSPTN